MSVLAALKERKDYGMFCQRCIDNALSPTLISGLLTIRFSLASGIEVSARIVAKQV